MLDRIDFSDIYKFLSSIGLALIVAAILIPFFVFQIDLSKNHILDTNTIPEIVKDSIQYQDCAINLVLKFWWIFSIILLVAGGILFLIGITKWNKRQEILDKIQEMDLRNKERLIKEANSKEISNKAEEDAEEINESDFNKRAFLQHYKSIELKIINSIKTNNPNIRIAPNAKLGKFVYDLLIIERLSNNERIHKICEIKYYQKEILYSYLHRGISSFLLSISHYQNYLVKDDRRIRLKFYMIWICNSIEQKNRLVSYKDKAMKFSKSKGVNIEIIIKQDSEIESIINELV